MEIVKSITVSSATIATISATNSYQYTSAHLRNDGGATVTITVGGLAIPVYANETFDDRFGPFSQISVANTGAGSYRLLLRGEG